jgi:tRNA (guanosine-2'-O-)-methyltransferase
MQQELYAYLANCISENRKNRIESLVQQRTRYLTIVLEDIFQPHNASAVLRSAEGFGVQDIHIIENKNTYAVNPDVALGSAKWLTLQKYRRHENNTMACISNLKAQGYRIVATTPHTNDCFVSELDVTKGKIALLFGTELEGLSKDAIEAADEYVRIPMYGFTESFNISVSAALCMYDLTGRIRKSGVDWKLRDEEQFELQLAWVRKTLQRADLLEAEFMKTRKGE